MNETIATLDSDSLPAISRDLPIVARLALRVLTGMPTGTLVLSMPDGRTVKVVGTQPGPEARLILHNWRLVTRAFTSGTIGVAESYVDGDWTSPDVAAFLELFALNEELGEKLAGGFGFVFNAAARLRHALNANTRGGSRKNIAAHYDLGNAFYEHWLDPSMTYSSGLFSDGAHSLEMAQREKYRALAEATEIGAADHVLEIGCGWGGFAEFAASEIGCKVTGLTISREQFDFASKRMFDAGLNDKVDIKLQDYRDEEGRYDRIASIEMFEAVGEQYWEVFFRRMRDCMKPNGVAGLQIITINDKVFDQYRKRPDFIQRYIFPGGMLPSPEILQSLSAKVGLDLTGERIFPQDYARTLALWRERFWSAWPKISSLGFDERFKKLWEFYLYYCEAGFRSEYIDVRQVIYR